MSHQPPVPAGNQSPFPSHEPPHVHDAKGPPPGVKVAKTPEPSSAIPRGALIGGLVAAGVAALAALAAIGTWAYATEPENKRKTRRRKK